MSGVGGGASAPDPSAGGRPEPFGDRLAAAVAARESQVVLGLDPDPARLWPVALGRTGEARARLAAALAAAQDAAADWAAAPLVAEDDRNGAANPPPLPGIGGPAPAHGAAVTPGAVARLEAAAAVLAHCSALVDAAGPACVAVKPQLACFERLGFAGWLALEATCAHARAAGLLLLADGKRGDVPVSATAYAQALVGGTPSPFGPAAGLGVDALTANPLLGRDALAPLVEGARAVGAGVFALVRTSNPGAADVLDLPLAGGEPLWERLAGLVAELGAAGPSGAPGASGLADVGAVTGATVPRHLARMRELMPHAPFLLPGVGAQGGEVSALAAAFAPGRAAGLVTVSRSIAEAAAQHGGRPPEAARREAERLREQAWNLV